MMPFSNFWPKKRKQRGPNQLSTEASTSSAATSAIPSEGTTTQLATASATPSAATSTSHPVGCEVLFEGAPPIMAESVPLRSPPIPRRRALLTDVCSIVFVHGLRGHRRHTWTKDDVCWPQELLSKESAMSQTRILTFGYDANVIGLTGSASLNSLFEHSINLLNELSRKRKDAVSLTHNLQTIKFDSCLFSGIAPSSSLHTLLVD
jgi:hypothetical protein